MGISSLTNSYFSEELKPQTSIEMARDCDFKDDENT
jgi:hypothetical protein